MLFCTFTVRTECEPVFRHLDFIAQDANQDFPILKKYVYEVRKDNLRYQIAGDGELYSTNLDIWDLIYSLMGCVHRCVFNIIDDSVRIHAGCGGYNGKRFLVVGDKGAGKTTLMTRLLFEGMHIEGDELVLIRDGKTVPFPRRFHIKKSSINLLPQLRDIIDTLPYIKKDDEPELYSFAPSNAGFDWKIENKKADIIFYIEPDHSKKTRVEKCPKYLMVQKAMPLTFFSDTHDHGKIGELCKAIDNAECFILHIGDLDGAVNTVHEKLNTA